MYGKFEYWELIYYNVNSVGTNEICSNYGGCTVPTSYLYINNYCSEFNGKEYKTRENV